MKKSDGDQITPNKVKKQTYSKSPEEELFVLDLKTLLGGNLFDDPSKEEVKDTESMGSDKERKNSIHDYVKAVRNFGNQVKKSVDGEGKTKGSTNPTKSMEESKVTKT